VIDPTDTITIDVDPNNAAGTFTATYSLPDKDGAVQTGACTGGAVNTATGIATLLCSPIGTFGTTAGNTCFDVKVTPPAGFTPAGEQEFLGSADPTNECFKLIPKIWRAETDSTPKQEQSVEVVDPSDKITIFGDGTVVGTFSASYVLKNESGTVIADGDCDATGSINTVPGPGFGEAMITCSTPLNTTVTTADGLTCFDVEIFLRSGNYSPSSIALVGADDPTNECFFVTSDIQGCTPGYWKANYDKLDASNWWTSDPTPDTLVQDVFMEATLDLNGKGGADNLRDALSYKGGGGLEGAERILLRAAAAAYLNTGLPFHNYGYGDTAKVVADVDQAIVDAYANPDEKVGRQILINLAGTLDTWNNFTDEDGLHCPLDNKRADD
jgi:hypothetical protein